MVIEEGAELTDVPALTACLTSALGPSVPLTLDGRPRAGAPYVEEIAITDRLRAAFLTASPRVDP